MTGVIPDWIDSSESKYMELSAFLTGRDMGILFNGLIFSNLFCVGLLFSNVIFEESWVVAVAILVTMVSALGFTAGLFIKVSRWGLSSRDYFELLTMMKLTHKAFLFGGLFFSLLVGVESIYVISVQSASFTEVMYTFPLAVLFYVMAVTYPLDVLRREAMKGEIKSAEKETTTETVHDSGRVVTIKENVDEASSDNEIELPSIALQIGRSKDDPLLLNADELETLEDEGCVDDYMRFFGGDNHQSHSGDT